MIRKPLVAGNWKMHGSQEQASQLAQAISVGYSNVDAEIALLVPYVYIAQIANLLSAHNIAWGAQDVSAHNSGAYTGEVSATMLHDLGCRYVIVGHSERRYYHHETAEQLLAKLQQALNQGLCPIFCVGEQLTDREAGKTLEIINQQLAVIKVLADNMGQIPEMVIAYEPVWAIGTGCQATPEQAQAVHQAIRQQLVQLVDKSFAECTRILYGGSVKPDNAAGLLVMPDIDGALVGGASLDAEQFLAIGQLCKQ